MQLSGAAGKKKEEEHNKHTKSIYVLILHAHVAACTHTHIYTRLCARWRISFRDRQ